MLKKYVQWTDTLTEYAGRGIAWMTTVLVVVVGSNVAMRYLIGQSSLALQELAWHLFGAIFFLGAGYTLKHDRHVRVDIIYGGLSERARAWIDLFGLVLLMLPFCLVGIWFSLDFVMYAFEIAEKSPDPGGLPARFIPKALIPAGFTLMLLQGCGEVARRVLFLRQFEGSGVEPG